MISGSSPLVSIGLPFFNPGSFIIEAVQSIFAQTYANWELIAVDDGSSDGTASLLSKIKDPRVRVLTDRKRLGLPTRLNQISQLASGKYVARFDADDMMHPKRLELQVLLLEKNPQVDFVATGHFVIDKKGYLVGIHFATPPSLLELFKLGGYLHPSIMARREWFLHNPYSPAYPRAEDRELFIRTNANSTATIIKEPLYFYRRVGNFRLRPFLRSYQSERKILLHYGFSQIGWIKTIGLLARSYLKSGAILIFRICHCDHLVTNRHYQPLSNGEMWKGGMEALAIICKKKVSGWE